MQRGLQYLSCVCVCLSRHAIVAVSGVIVLSSILRLREEMGRAFSQTPDSVVEAARRRAVDSAFRAESNKAKAEADTLGASQVFWRYEAVPTGRGWLWS